MTTKQVIKGSLNAELSCNFSLSADLSVITVSISFGGTALASFAQSQQALSVSPGFESRFNVTWVPNELKLIFFNITSAGFLVLLDSSYKLGKEKFRCLVSLVNLRILTINYFL